MGARHLVLAIGAVHIAVILWFLLMFRPGFVDLDVYRLGANAWRSGNDVYGDLPTTNLPFTYPPISAVLFTPFALVPFSSAAVLLTTLSVAALVVGVIVVLRALDVRPVGYAVALALPVALVVEPVRLTLEFGQVNLLLMVLVVLDCLVARPRWRRGVLIGIAAAVKLTPAMFVLFFLVRGDRKAALTSVVSFLAGTALGFLFNWPGSVRFWTSTIFDTGRIGTVTARSNQSITALLTRLGIESVSLWVALAVALLVLAVLGMRRAVAAGQPVLALGLCALAVLPVSPVAWSHHWVWCVPVLLCLVVTAWRTQAATAIAVAAGGVAVFVLSPQWWWDKAEPWTAGRILPGNTYLWFAIVVLCVAAFSPVRRVPRLPAVRQGRSERQSPGSPSAVA